MTLIDAAETIIFFAYGNDRKGIGMLPFVHDATESELGLARAPFVKLYYADATCLFPVAVFSGTRNTQAVGEVLELRLDETVTSILGAMVEMGYNLSDVEVDLAVGGKIMAMVPTWTKEHGLAVPQNDWLSQERLRTW